MLNLKDDDDLSGIVFLPFANWDTGKDVVFDVPKSFFAVSKAASSGPDSSLLKNLRKSVTAEMLSNLEDAASREEKQYNEVLIEELPKIAREMAAARDAKL